MRKDAFRMNYNQHSNSKQKENDQNSNLIKPSYFKDNESKNLSQNNEIYSNPFGQKLDANSGYIRSKLQSANINRIEGVIQNYDEDFELNYDPGVQSSRRDNSQPKAFQKFPEISESNVMLTDPHYLRLLSSKNSNTNRSYKKKFNISLNDKSVYIFYKFKIFNKILGKKSGPTVKLWLTRYGLKNTYNNCRTSFRSKK